MRFSQASLIVGLLTLSCTSIHHPAPPAPKPLPDSAGVAHNPFEGARFYVNPGFVQEVEQTAATLPAKSALLRKVEPYSTAVWIDEIAHIDRVAQTLDGAAAEQKSANAPVLSVFVVYDLPNRDCAANASAGELAVGEEGERRYRAEFIDAIAAQFRAHPGQRIVALVEPDSLGNLATNLNIHKCSVSNEAYRQSIAYAVKTLSLPNVSVYLDAAHAGWLGWNGNRDAIAGVYADVLTRAGGAHLIRGFFTNVANYNVVRGDDNRQLEPSNPCPDEMTYVYELGKTLASAGIVGKHFIIDTGRDGRGGIRTKWGNWCNIKRAGLGERPRASPAPGVDAFYWVKTPGESDGAADPADPHFDMNCRSDDAEPGAPPAGKWFARYFVELAENARPPL
ncbi:MAG TPA: glycoside hydrolase family 6 protein [Polyangiaceae bacterium]